jgi:hypothetical protein
MRASRLADDDMDERVYYISWSQALSMGSFSIALGVAGSMRQVFRGPPNGSWATILLTFGALTALVVLAARYAMQVRVSREGIRTTGGKVFRWSDMETITPSRRLFRGFFVQSTLVPTIQVAESIAVRLDFREDVLARISANHPLAVYLREN